MTKHKPQSLFCPLAHEITAGKVQVLQFDGFQQLDRDLVKDVPRYFINPEVAQAVRNLKIPDDKLSAAMKFCRLPFNDVWIETRISGARIGWFLTQNLQEDADEVMRFKAVMEVGNHASSTNTLYIVRRDGSVDNYFNGIPIKEILGGTPDMGFSYETIKNVWDLNQGMNHFVVRLAILMHSRGKYLEISDVREEAERKAISRKKMGLKPTMAATHSIDFDVSRTIKSGRVTDSEARAYLGNTLVTGHFKFIKPTKFGPDNIPLNGACFWWNDHGRRTLNPVDNSDRERRIVSRKGPGRLHEIPANKPLVVDYAASSQAKPGVQPTKPAPSTPSVGTTNAGASPTGAIRRIKSWFNLSPK